MSDIGFVSPAASHEAQAIAYQEAFAARGLLPAGMAWLEHFGGYQGWLDFLAAPAGTLLPTGVPKVESSTFFAWHEADARIVGVTNIRHTLNAHLRRIGGHVGYSVHPDYWHRGYATQMLAFALTQTDALGITEVLVTCDEHNHASARVIVKNGGVLQEIAEVEGKRVARYWIRRTL